MIYAHILIIIPYMVVKKRFFFIILIILLSTVGIFSAQEDNKNNNSLEDEVKTGTAKQTVSAKQLVENIKNHEYTGSPRNFILKNSSFRDFILGLSEYSGINMVIDPGVSGTISCYLKKVPWDQALALFLKQNGLEISAEENIIRIQRKVTGKFFRSLFFKMLLLAIFLSAAVSAVFLFRKKSPANASSRKKTDLNPHFAREYAKKLTHLLETKKVYRDENLSLQSLAKELTIPTYQLSRIINENMNKTFSELINYYRIEEAKKLLAASKESDQKILDIAYDVGFSTKTSFNKVFKKYTNMTPSEFREIKE